MASVQYDSVYDAHEKFENDPLFVTYAVSVGWWVLVLGIMLNGLLCHISPGLMVFLQSNPWTTQLNWLFGIKAQNYQALNLVLYHQSTLGKLTHYPTIALDFFAWTYITGYGLGKAAHVLVLCLVVGQAVSSKFTPLILLTGACAVASFALGIVTKDHLSSEQQLAVLHWMQAAVLFGAATRVLGHAFEDKVPPMPLLRSDTVLFRFKALEHTVSSIVTKKNMSAMAMGVFAEASAGMPLRLFVPLLNVAIGSMQESLSLQLGERPDGLESLSKLQAKSRDVLVKGWTLANPSAANLIQSAIKLETLPETLPDMFLPDRWFWFFLLESGAIFTASLIWMDQLTASTSILYMGYTWVLLRMLAAKNLDIRSFVFVVEAATIYGILKMLLMAGSCYWSGVVPTSSTAPDHHQDLQSLLVRTAVLSAVTGVHFLFLSVEVPALHASLRKRRLSESSCNEDSSSGSDDDDLDQHFAGMRRASSRMWRRVSKVSDFAHASSDLNGTGASDNDDDDDAFSNTSSTKKRRAVFGHWKRPPSTTSESPLVRQRGTGNAAAHASATPGDTEDN